MPEQHGRAMQEQLPGEPSSLGAAPVAGAGTRSQEGPCRTPCAELGVAKEEQQPLSGASHE